MYSIFSQRVHWSHLIPVPPMWSTCTQWVKGPLSPVNATHMCSVVPSIFYKGPGCQHVQGRSINLTRRLCKHLDYPHYPQCSKLSSHSCVRRRNSSLLDTWKCLEDVTKFLPQPIPTPPRLFPSLLPWLCYGRYCNAAAVQRPRSHYTQAIGLSGV
jgi:hypothetical protein